MPLPFRVPSVAIFVLLSSAGAFLLAQSPSAPIQLVQGIQVGKTIFEPGDTARGGNGQPIDGIEGASREMLSVHIHAHLSLFLKGQQMAIPYGIGIVKPFRLENGFVGTGSGFYWLHTHDATGIIHIEAPDARSFTLGNFFDVWGEPLTTGGVAGIDGPVSVFVDGHAYTGDPRAIVLAAHMQITLEIGGPVVPPPVYLFPNGL
jgi:hypothetical protein